MISALLIAHNDKEREILKMLLEQAAFKVVDSKPNYANYIRSIQYKPEVVVLEAPRYFTEELNFIRLIRKNRIVSNSSIVIYGDHSDRLIINSFKNNGADFYFMRPLKSQELLHTIRGILQRRGKTMASNPAQTQEERVDESKLLLDRSVAGSRKLEIMVKSIGSLLAFPFAVAKVLQLTTDSDSGAEDISKVILTDPVMTATILKLANSVLFASRDRKVTEVREAVVRIGFQETRRIVISLAVMKLFTKEEKSIGFDRLEFWYHSLACAVIAERLAKNLQYPRPAEAFVSGLLHDFGIILLDEVFPAIFGQIIERTTKYGSSFAKEGRDLLGVGHDEMTQKMFELWKLPDPVIYTVRNHLAFFESKPNLDKSLNDLNRCVGLANLLSKCLIFGHDVDFYVSPVPNQILEEMRIPYGLDKRFIDETCTQLNMFASFLNLDQRTFPPKESQIRGAENIRIAFCDRNEFLCNPFFWYLNSQHYNIRKLGSLNDFSVGGRAPDLIVLHVSGNEKPEDIGGLLKQIRASVSTGNATIPILVLHVAGRVDLSQLKSEIQFRDLSDQMDLRNLDRIIERVMGGDQTEQAKELQIFLNALGGGESIIKAVGSLSVNNLAVLRDTVNDLTAGEGKRIIFDLEDVDAIDSSSLRTLINLHKKTEKAGGVVIIRPSAAALKVLEAANLHRGFKIHKHESEIVLLKPVIAMTQPQPMESMAAQSPALEETPKETTGDTQAQNNKPNDAAAEDVIGSLSL